MGMIRCPKCDSAISDRVSKCPHCGNPVESRPNRYSQFYEKPRPQTYQPEPQYVEVREERTRPQRSSKGLGLSISALIISVMGFLMSFLAILIAASRPREVYTDSQISTRVIENQEIPTEPENNEISDDEMIVEEQPQNSSNNKPSKLNLADQMEITEYSMEGMFSTTYYVLVVKNNSSETVELSTNAVAKDVTGKTIGAANSGENAVESGQEVCLLHFFDGVTEAESFEYTMTVEKETFYKPVFSDLYVDESITEDKIILTVTNKGNRPADFVEARALFFYEGEFVYTSSTYITDNESEIKPNATISKEIESIKDFDDVKVYFSGRR